MKALFRVDAAPHMGSGHLMRCMTLAMAWRARGTACHFLCRCQPGFSSRPLEEAGFPVSILPAPEESSWLGVSEQQDAADSLPIITDIAPDWLVVDHYALSTDWEVRARDNTDRLLVIDDLADRPHCCDVLVDQNLGRDQSDYQALLPSSCQVLTGPAYAMLRPEFALNRSASLARRADSRCRHLLISMGGSDPGGATGLVLKGLKECRLPDLERITVIMGSMAPGLEQIRQLGNSLQWPVDMAVNVADMASRMATADLAIGAAGSSAWERCALGLPTVMVILADNQRVGARALEESGAAVTLGGVDDIAVDLPACVESLQAPERLQAMSRKAAAVTDGSGVNRVLDTLIGS
ncbi:UDP-2,4-diacetamido-2,4,6-trideoxy-beta-L-altropyranose hydrolase [Alloalcanivorax marinus]|uniref:UDP-2,4-diacetamido-2,4, 6-trideoxy-beta-L-altropyranose hydrolase n=1 Tax=Alloalcanivorax marinus TaxID=1177169 RepID=UPI001933E78F|nr:UDP-2,4-diacetamido-2,4,6-trideoxy-beta-L-altropyranose hydrolase [Alloalcanivorax marinus]MBL7249437.1 UDP-2,4-diacetamido-2,4,6-trideoxy-beta-L-altropyranose hydrolase [Alloalcanivorax marinus]